MRDTRYIRYIDSHAYKRLSHVSPVRTSVKIESDLSSPGNFIHRFTINSSFFFFFEMTGPPPRSTLFPYPTLFRSKVENIAHRDPVSAQKLGRSSGRKSFDSQRREAFRKSHDASFVKNADERALHRHVFLRNEKSTTV